MPVNKEYCFIRPTDELATRINEKARELYQQLRNLDISDSNIDDFGRYYFREHHLGPRLVFSLESSAAIIYDSVRLLGKDIKDSSFIDYGAGLGTLFLLAGKLGFRKTYFNDYFPKWGEYARIICEKLNIRIDGYIDGDIAAVIEYGKTHATDFDILASRNVVEHIYNLDDFYNRLFRSGLTRICYSTTTANYHNVAIRWRHYGLHKRAEDSLYRKQREDSIRERAPHIRQDDLRMLVALTRGRAFDDFTKAVADQQAGIPVQPLAGLGTNTCDCQTGVWAEHLITRQRYEQIIRNAGWEFSYTAGFWDTHYRYAGVNWVTRILNRVLKGVGKKAYWLSPFVNVVAIKR